MMKCRLEVSTLSPRRLFGRKHRAAERPSLPWSLLIGLLPVGLLAGSAAGVSGCASGAEEELRHELTSLREEVRELKQIKHDLNSVESDLTSIRAMLKNEDARPQPIREAEFRPDGSHMDDPFLGPKDSDVLVLSFTDFQCAPCRRFYKETFGSLKAELIDTGMIKLIARDYPLASNAHSVTAATAAHCAGEQGAYWEMFALLFEHPEAVDRGDIGGLAKRLTALDQDKLQSCITSGRYHNEIYRDIREATVLGAKGAPAFFIGRKDGEHYRGVFVRGAQPFPVLRGEVRKQLAALKREGENNDGPRQGTPDES